MDENLEFMVSAIVIGAGATVVMDIWAMLLKRLLGIPSLDWGMVGRWIGHLAGGQFTHESIVAASPIQGERIVGWSAHYTIGIFFAAVLLIIWGLDWAQNPTLQPALVVGISTIAAPYFIMQPAMGAGIAASKTPTPNKARLLSLCAHTAFGLGLYISATLFAMV